MFRNTHDFETQTDTRLTDIEVKLSYSEDLLEQLNVLVYRQQEQIEALQAQIHRLHLMQTSRTDEPGTRDPRDELPPHY